MRGGGRYLLIGLILFGVLLTGPRPVAKVAAQTAPTTPVDCTGLLGKLNSIGLGGINSVVQCKAGDTPATYNKLLTVIQFQQEIDGGLYQTYYPPINYPYNVAQNWTSCAVGNAGSNGLPNGTCNVYRLPANGGSPQLSTINSSWIDNRNTAYPVTGWFRDCGSGFTEQYTGWTCQTVSNGHDSSGNYSYTRQAFVVFWLEHEPGPDRLG